MAIPILGQQSQSGTLFDRTFFNVRLEQLIEASHGGDMVRVNAFLSDGTVLGLCHVVELAGDHMVVRAHGDENQCDLSLHVIPYQLIYRLEIDPNGGEGDRLGFHRTSNPKA